MKASHLLVLRFTVREFYYDEKEIKREREEMSRLLSDKKQQYVSRLHGQAGVFLERPPPLGARGLGHVSPETARAGHPGDT